MKNGEKQIFKVFGGKKHKPILSEEFCHDYFNILVINYS